MVCEPLGNSVSVNCCARLRKPRKFCDFGAWPTLTQPEPWWATAVPSFSCTERHRFPCCGRKSSCTSCSVACCELRELNGFLEVTELTTEQTDSTGAPPARCAAPFVYSIGSS